MRDEIVVLAAIAVIALFVFLAYCCCVAAGKADENTEEERRKAVNAAKRKQSENEMDTEAKDTKKKIIAIDFDGTLFETDYPDILRPIQTVIDMAKAEQANGARLILWTCREGKELKEAVEACRSVGLEFDAVNENLPEMIALYGTNPRKISASQYWDDRNGFISEKERIKNEY